MKFSNSMIDSYFTCPAHFYWQYIQRIEPVTKSADLDYGSVLHRTMATYFLTFDRELALKVMKTEYQNLDIASRLVTRNKAKTLQTGEFLLDKVIKLKLEKDGKVSGTERMVEKSLPSGLTYRGKIDLELSNTFTEDLGWNPSVTEPKETVIDFKSTSRKDIAFQLLKWELSRQFKGYCWLKSTLNVRVIILNALLEPDVFDHWITPTQEEIELWVEETDAMCNMLIRKMEKVKEIGTNWTNRSFPRGVTKCQIFNCGFFELCIQGRFENVEIDPTRFIPREERA